MIYFITNRNHHIYDNPKDIFEVVLPDDIRVLSGEEGRKLLIKKIENLLTSSKLPIYIAKDKETTGLDPHKDEELFEALGFKDGDQLVFDSYSVDYADIEKQYNDDICWIGQNLKFDCSFDITKNDFYYKNLFDFMIADQRITQGITDRKHNLIALLNNYGIAIPYEMNKETRLEFVGLTPKSYRATRKHVLYAAADVGKSIFELYNKLKEAAFLYKVNKVLKMEFAKLPQLALSEVTGIDLDKEAWRTLYKKKEKDLFETDCNLDKELKQLVLNSNSPYKNELQGGTWTIQRNNVIEQMKTLDLFGNVTLQHNKKAKVNTNQYIKHNSNKVLKQVFGALGAPVIDEYGNITFCYKLPNNDWGPSTGISFSKDNLLKLLDEKPNHILRKYIELLIHRSSLQKSVTTYGEEFLNKYINIKTGKIHTIYRQARAITSRTQSGDVRAGRPNMQNIPADPEYRTPFIAPPNCSLTTGDLEGAELILICANSGSTKLFELSKKDMHSYFATLNWKDIYAYRGALEIGANFLNADQFMKERHRYFNLAKLALQNGTATENQRKSIEFVCSKKETPDIRTNHKPMTFGTIYQAHGKTLGKQLNIPLIEGEIVRLGIRQELPKVFKYTDDMFNLAMEQGYLIISEKINSRIWFPKVIKSKMTGEEMDWSDIIAMKSFCANIRIQGGQADMLKRAAANIFWYNHKYKVPAKLLLEVHDEFVASQPLNMDGESKEWKANPKGVVFTPSTPTSKSEFERYIEGKEHHVLKAEFFKEGFLKRTLISYPMFIKMQMVDAANWFLEGKPVKMNAAFNVASHWVK